VCWYSLWRFIITWASCSWNHAVDVWIDAAAWRRLYSEQFHALTCFFLTVYIKIWLSKQLSKKYIWDINILIRLIFKNVLIEIYMKYVYMQFRINLWSVSACGQNIQENKLYKIDKFDHCCIRLDMILKYLFYILLVI